MTELTARDIVALMIEGPKTVENIDRILDWSGDLVSEDAVVASTPYMIFSLSKNDLIAIHLHSIIARARTRRVEEPESKVADWLRFLRDELLESSNTELLTATYKGAAALLEELGHAPLPGALEKQLAVIEGKKI